MPKATKKTPTKSSSKKPAAKKPAAKKPAAKKPAAKKHKKGTVGWLIEQLKGLPSNMEVAPVPTLSLMLQVDNCVLL